MSRRNKPKKNAKLIAQIKMHCEEDPNPYNPKDPFLYKIYDEGDKVPKDAPDKSARGEKMYRMYVEGCKWDEPHLVKIATWDFFVKFANEPVRQKWILEKQGIKKSLTDGLVF